MRSIQSAFTLVLALFILLIGAFTILQGYRAVHDALEDTSSVLGLVRQVLLEAPLWANALVLIGLANLFSLIIWPWLKQQIAGKQAAFASFPDWPVRELFFHLDPKVLEEPHLANWETIGRVLIDNLSIGRLRSWGRPYLGSLEKTEHNSTLVEIPSEYWAKGGDLSYMFFAERYAGHTIPPYHSSLPEYADMQLNKVQALCATWPKLQAATLPLMEVAARAYEETQGRSIAETANREACDASIIVWYCNAVWARTTLYGRTSPSEDIKKITRDHRTSYSFEVGSSGLILKDRGSEEQFYDLQIMENEVPSLIEALKGIG